MAPKPRIKGGATGAKNSKSLFSSGSLMTGLTLGTTALSIASVSGALQGLGLPDMTELLSNPLALGAVAVGLLILLK
jgi:hypothetical protein